MGRKVSLLFHPTFDRSLSSRVPYPLAPGAQVAEAVAGASPDYSLMPIHPAELGSPSSLDIHKSQRVPCIVFLSSTKNRNHSSIDFQSLLLLQSCLIWAHSDNE